MDPDTTTNVLLAVIALLGAFATALLGFVLTSVSRIDGRVSTLESTLPARFDATGDRIVHEVRTIVRDLDERLRILEDRPGR